jgi:predicted membrane-bound spermidine synthase
LADSFGRGPDVAATFLSVGVAAFAIGAARGPRIFLARASLGWAGGVRLALLGIASLAAPFLASTAAKALVWAGASLDAGPIATTFSRVLLGGLVLFPVAASAGTILRITGDLFREDRGGGPRAPWIVAGGGTGLLLANLDSLLWESNHVPLIAGFLLLLASAFYLTRSRRARPLSGKSNGAPDPGSLAASGGVAFAFTAFTFLTFRAHLFSFANDLPRVPIAPFLFVLGFFLGSLAALGAARKLTARSGAASGVCLLLAAAASVASLGSLDSIPSRFVETASAAESFSEILREALRLAAPTVGPVGFFVGAGAGLLSAGIPGSRRGRPGWIARVAVAAALGAAAGAVFSRFALPPLEIAGTIRWGSLGLALVAAAALAWSGGFSPIRLAVSLGLFALVAGAAVSAGDMDRLALLVDRRMSSPSLPFYQVQRNWKVYDEDEALSSVAVLKRGHARRLFINGRFEMSNETEIKSHGLLAHLPLLIHRDPKSVLLLGPANGLSLAACLAHPIEDVHCLAESRAPVKATARFGPEARAALRDHRVTIRVGDFHDLLARIRGS